MFYPLLQIIDQVPKLMQRLREEDTASSQSCMTKMAELIYCLMYHHAGYPELYDSLLDALKVRHIKHQS